MAPPSDQTWQQKQWQVSKGDSLGEYERHCLGNILDDSKKSSPMPVQMQQPSPKLLSPIPMQQVFSPMQELSSSPIPMPMTSSPMPISSIPQLSSSISSGLNSQFFAGNFSHIQFHPNNSLYQDFPRRDIYPSNFPPSNFPRDNSFPRDNGFPRRNNIQSTQRPKTINGKSVVNGIDLSKLKFVKPAPQCVHWDEPRHKFEQPNCRFWHPRELCKYYPTCHLTAEVCGLGHKHCSKDYCKCDPKKRSKQLNHRILSQKAQELEKTEAGSEAESETGSGSWTTVRRRFGNGSARFPTWM